MKSRNVRTLMCNWSLVAMIIVLLCLTNRCGSFDGSASGGGAVWGLGVVLVALGGLLFWVSHARIRYRDRVLERELFAVSPTGLRTQRAADVGAKGMAFSEQPDEKELFCAPDETFKRDDSLLRWTRVVKTLFWR